MHRVSGRSERDEEKAHKFNDSLFFFSSRRRHTRFDCDWSSDVCSSDLGEVIFNQGDLADAFYLVRIGFVKVTEKYPGGELVLAYISKGSYFGEIGLLGGGKRTATCSALDHVEVVRISAEDFKQMLERFPAIRAQLDQIATQRL